MKKYRYRFFQVVTGIILFAIVLSCEDFLNEVPGDKLTSDQHYKTSIDAEISMIGAYSVLQEVMPNLVIMNDLRSDLMIETENFDEDLRKINRHDISIDNIYNDPTGYYRIIINANEVLKNLWKIHEYDRDYDSAYHSLNIINMVSLRSWAYFTLVRLYGEAAYIPEDMSSFDENYQFEYYSKSRMIDTLISQLDSAFTYPDQIVNKNWSTLALYERALRGELYLEKGDYQNAVKYLTIAIGDNDIKLFKADDTYEKENWKSIFVYTSGQETEVISTILYSYQDNQENPLSDIFYEDRKYLVKPSDYIVNLFSNQVTVREEIGDLYRGEGISYAYSGPEQKLMVNKYSIDPNESSGADIIVYRAADLHLLLAEALNQIGDYETAMKIINDGANDFKGWKNNVGIRGRVSLKPKEMPTGNVKNAIEDMIMEERALELAFEGKRWFDLVRVANRRGASYLAEKVAAKYQSPALASTVKNKLLDKKNWYLPFRK